MTIKEKYINPYTDFGFKKLFGEEANKDLLIDFLNNLIKEQGTITDVKYLNPAQLGRSAFERKAIFDIYCENERGEKFIVEMQNAKQNYFKDRSIYYTTFPIQKQAVAGEWDFRLTPVYFVGILDFVFDEDKNDLNYYHHEVKMMEIHKKTIFYEKLCFIYLEMPKFDKEEKDLETHFDKWMYVLKHLPKFQERPVALQERIFKRLFGVAEIANFTPEEADAYEDSIKTYRDNYAVYSTALDEGRDLEKIEIARNCLKEGLAIDVIVRITGLSADEISRLM